MMKKMMMASAFLLPVVLTGCNGKQECRRSADAGKEAVYTGTVPAADVSGVRYTLHIDYDDDNDCTDGDYRMYETYVKADTAVLSGYKDLRTIRSEGDFYVETGSSADPKLRYLKLVPDVRDSDSGVSAEPVYFAMTSDSTLVMLGSHLALPDRPADYTLTAR